MRKISYYTRLSISFPEPVYSNQSAECISRKMAEQRSAEDFTAFVDFLRSTIERTASVYHSYDHERLEICARKLEEHIGMVIAISLSQNSSPDLFEVLELCY